MRQRHHALFVERLYDTLVKGTAAALLRRVFCRRLQALVDDRMIREAGA